MKTIKTKVYEFNELSDKAKEKAREWFRNGYCDGEFDAEFIIEDAVTQGEAMGIEFAERQAKLMSGKTIGKPIVYYSGFSSQGDGACFEGSWRALDVKPGKLAEHAPQDVELNRIAKEFERIALAFPNSSFSVKHRGHYYHKYETVFDVRIFDNDDNEIDTPESSQASEDLIETARDFMQWIYRQLEKDYNWRNKDAQVDENILANEYTFTETGKRFG